MKIIRDVLKFEISNDRESYNVVSCDKNVVSVEIPSFYNELPVKRILNKAFSECTKLKEIIINEGVIEIGDYSFEKCCSLYFISIPDTVLKIGCGAFYSCGKLREIILPYSLGEETNMNLFYGCYSLSVVFVPKSLKDILRRLSYSEKCIYCYY